MKEMECPLYTVGVGFTGDTSAGGEGTSSAAAAGTDVEMADAEQISGGDGHRAKVEEFLQHMANQTGGIVQPSTSGLVVF
mmetsp:Transcript_42025/g.104930  ORF Transcript_42025/g.104930 Transcript_42025/m.104930 type:complete len:80 (-) Transcript_42025:247-486(-)